MTPFFSLPSPHNLAWIFLPLFLTLLIYFIIDFGAFSGYQPYKPSITEIQHSINLHTLSLPLSNQVSLAHGQSAVAYRQQCYPFLFPRPTSSIFITGWSNHGAGLGHQFGEWLFAPALAHMLGLTYVHTPFMGNAGRWARWLGFGAGEDTEIDIYNSFSTVRVVEFHEAVFHSKNNTLTAEQWVAQRRREHEASMRNDWPMNVSTFTNQLTTTNADALATHATLLRLYRIHVPHPAQRYSCQPALNLLIRQKYCAARVEDPVTEDLYENDRNNSKIIVAFHLRCGDSCYDPFRTTPFTSVILTIKTINELLVQSGLGEPVFHLFSQPPLNQPAELHFAPLMIELKASGLQATGHWHTHSHTTLHHLVTSDILIGAQSSFSWVASLLHHTVAMGPVSTCRWQVRGYDKRYGTFNNESLILNFNRSRTHVPKFRSLNDCRMYKQWNDDFRPEEGNQ